MQPEKLVIILHICMVLVYAIFIFFRISRLRMEHIIPLCFIPVVGPFLALTIEYMIFSGKQGRESPDLESLGLDNNILWTTLKSFHDKGDLVPLEEAVLIDEVEVGRRSMLETLYADPVKYLSVLNTAKYNEDIEISHYATTTISKTQRDFQLSIQRAAIEMERHPDDRNALNIYIEYLGNYIQSGLLEEDLLRNLRIAYAKALDKKLDRVKDDKDTLTEKLRNAVELKDIGTAFTVSQLLREYWPEDEQTWIEALRVCVEGRDGAELKKTIEEIQRREIIWTESGREQVSLWIKVVA